MSPTRRRMSTHSHGVVVDPSSSPEAMILAATGVGDLPPGLDLEHDPDYIEEMTMLDNPAPEPETAPLSGTTGNPPDLSVKIERNSKGFNYEVGVTGAHTVRDLRYLLREVHNVARDEIAAASIPTEA